ncbi:hypothetical protein Ppb6_00647 [Photorhabdus australis subsp. thailandensis]|uniref:PAS domain-containing protein n=1 Tax=Photorhabdus australis subsp. thailandensis TaxID=2805096 RepID=A0A1C0U859_9GAMM|nr:hypothetical protein [Photorhabdus australis]OCQ54097.1 hypothetical protein Ppb6_00647 [Photorhabdus australis subsp. thailandensis]
MAVSGVRIQDSQGKPIIEVNDRMGRIVGYHEIPALGRNGYFKKTFSHPELAGMGEIFVWSDVIDEFWQIKGTGNITVSGTNITIEVRIGRGGTGAPITSPVKVFYGVR